MKEWQLMWFTQLYHLNLRLFIRPSSLKNSVFRMKWNIVHSEAWNKLKQRYFSVEKPNLYVLFYLFTLFHQKKKQLIKKQWMVKLVVMSLTVNIFSPTACLKCVKFWVAVMTPIFNVPLNLVSPFCWHICLHMSR